MTGQGAGAPRPWQVAVIGPSDCTPGEARAAEIAGRILAERGAILVSGGMSGVMEASCRGARDAGGIAIGILPWGGEGNAHLSVRVRTGMSHARNFIVVESADAVVAIGKGYGTLSEIAFALKTGKPVYGYRTWEIPGVTACESPEEACLRALSAASP
ncbi:MAG: TIGR00725 family protein [Methanolinea sp.]|nr:TIGR00725 family protein [Methanolinea sp.]